jgi:hypothetical protein
MPKPANFIYGAFVLVCLAAVTWPGMSIIGTMIEPRILGMPPAVAWSGLWIVLSFLALIAYDFAAERES